MTTAQDLVGAAIGKAGGLNKLARLMSVAPNSVAQWRDGRALPEWFRANRLSEISGEPLEVVQGLLTVAHQQRSERRRRGEDMSSSGWNRDRLPLAKAQAGAERLVASGARRLHRTVRVPA